MTQTDNRYGRYHLKELKARGVLIENMDPGLTSLEKEASISFSEESDSMVAIDTFSPAWMRRIEGMGVLPRQVYSYPNGQCRFYRLPKSR